MLNSKNNRTEWGLLCLMYTCQNEANVSDHSFNMVEFDQFKNTAHFNLGIKTQIKPTEIEGFKHKTYYESNMINQTIRIEFDAFKKYPGYSYRLFALYKMVNINALVSIVVNRRFVL